MGKDTEIPWTDHTFNPWWGCVKVSPACDHCYAEAFAKRTGHKVWGRTAPRRYFGVEHWNEPFNWYHAAVRAGVRRRVFCGSMCDVMEHHDYITNDIRKSLCGVIEATINLDWLLLTKRPEYFRRFLPKRWLENPRPNVWGMTTVERADYLWRAEELVNTPFAVRGLSMEPLLGPVDLTRVLGGSIHWVIVGGESGHGARPMEAEWVRAIKDQCEAAGVPFFMKQGSQANWKTFKDFSSFPADLQVREFPAAR